MILDTFSQQYYFLPGMEEIRMFNQIKKGIHVTRMPFLNGNPNRSKTDGLTK